MDSLQITVIFVHIVYIEGDATLNKIYICLISLKQNLEKSSFFGQDSLLKNKRKSQREYFAIQKKDIILFGL